MIDPSDLDTIARSPSVSAWDKVIRAADALGDDDQGAACLTALDGATQGWERDPLRRWWASMTSWRAKGASNWVCGDLRRAPDGWVKEILADQHQPKHALVRALSLEATKATATTASRMFDSPYVTCVTTLDLGRDTKLARAFYKKLATSKIFENLSTLVYYPLQLGGGEELASAPRSNALRHLHLRAIVYSTDNLACTADVDALFRAPWISQIETLESSMGQSTGWSRSASIYRSILDHSARLTSLRRLILHDATGLDDLMLAPVLDQIEEIVLQLDTAKALGFVLKKLEDRALPRLRRLDLSQLRVENVQKKQPFIPLAEREIRTLLDSSSHSKRVPEIVLTPP